MHRGNLDKAEAYLCKAIASDDSNGLAHSYLGLLYKQQGDLERARAELETAVYYSPGNLTANFNLGAVCLEQGYYDGAVEYFGKVLDEKPEDVEARYWLALCLEALGKNEEALDNIRYLKDAGHSDPAFDTVEDRLKEKLGK
jgi:tetratricopeptide (TPR) repeat protein